MSNVDLQTELTEARARLRALKLRQKAENQARKRSAIEKPASGSDPDLLWGGRAIGKFIARSETQVSHMFRTGVFGDAVRKASHKRLVGSRSALLALFGGKPASES
jgi:hypothetical protein